MIEAELKRVIQDFPDYPKPGIMFKDISPILMDMDLFTKVIKTFHELLIDLNIDVILGVESRGFWFGPAIAQQLNIPFIPIRKKGKLPGAVFSKTYQLEYGTATIEIQKDRLKKNSRVLIHDDLLATGGTAKAAAELVNLAGSQVVGFAFLVNLTFLKLEQDLDAISNNIISIVNYK
jgi:adenine phosphoribosyltransferase